MPYKVIVDDSPVYELLVSLYLYIHRVRGAELSAAWEKGVNQKLSPELASELTDKRLEVIHRFGVLVWKCPHKSTVQLFLDWLDTLPVTEFIAPMKPWVDKFAEEPHILKHRMVRILRQWNEEFYQHLPPEMFANLRKSAREEMDRARFEPAVAQIERITSGIYLLPTDTERTIVLVPQYHLAPHTVLDFFDEGLVVLQYPAMHSDHEVSQQEAWLRVTRCLADEHRLRILEFLSEQPRTYTEITKFIQLGKGLVHYHIMQLRLAGLIHAHYRNGRIQDYGLRRERIVQFTEHLLGRMNMAHHPDATMA